MAIDLDNKIVQEIKDLGQKYDVQKIVLFGSRARGDSKPTSDIDLAIYPFENFAKAGCLANDIDELDTLLKIDTVFIRSNTNQKLLENINKEGVILYEHRE